MTFILKKIPVIIYVLASLLLVAYLSIPNLPFPKPPVNSLQSEEPADVEDQLRRGYYYNGVRGEAIRYYKSEFDNINLFSKDLNLFSLRLNYPPEESQTIIRDQTRSTYLEEIVHPLRESLFVNGFEPKKDNDLIYVNNVKFSQKLIIKAVNSNIYMRLIIGISIIIFAYQQTYNWKIFLKYFFKAYEK